MFSLDAFGENREAVQNLFCAAEGLTDRAKRRRFHC